MSQRELDEFRQLVSQYRPSADQEQFRRAFMDSVMGSAGSTATPGGFFSLSVSSVASADVAAAPATSTVVSGPISSSSASSSSVLACDASLQPASPTTKKPNLTRSTCTALVSTAQLVAQDSWRHIFDCEENVTRFARAMAILRERLTDNTTEAQSVSVEFLLQMVRLVDQIVQLQLKYDPDECTLVAELNNARFCLIHAASTLLAKEPQFILMPRRFGYLSARVDPWLVLAKAATCLLHRWFPVFVFRAHTFRELGPTMHKSLRNYQQRLLYNPLLRRELTREHKFEEAYAAHMAALRYRRKCAKTAFETFYAVIDVSPATEMYGESRVDVFSIVYGYMGSSYPNTLETVLSTNES